MTAQKGITFNASVFGLALLLTSEICFYTPETIGIYIALSGSGMLIIFLANLKYASLNIKLNSCGIWLVMVYGLYLFYGIFFLQSGTFSATTMLYRLFESLAYYIGLTTVVSTDYKVLHRIFLFSGAIAIGLIVAKEGKLIGSEGVRIGDSLSGNVNTVGFSLGIISLITAWSYCVEKKHSRLLALAVLFVFILFTGSKKALIIVVFDLLLIIVYQKALASTWLKAAFIIALGSYCIFNVPYLYDIMGSRIEAMISTLLHGSSAEHYSYSTTMRSLLIDEGLSFFKDKPIIGGGYNYFYSRTTTPYDYSHCNYIELLCSFGVLGTSLFYSRHISILHNLSLYRHKNMGYETHTFMLALFLVTTSLVLDWSVVSFSAQSIWYIPVVLASVAIETTGTLAKSEMGTHE